MAPKRAAPLPPPGAPGAFQARVWAVVARIPHGRVASYKDVGLYAGYPRAARHVGRAMAACDGAALPWHRVLASDGRIAITDPRLRKEQMLLLRQEGVPVSDAGRVDYGAFAWQPRSPVV